MELSKLSINQIELFSEAYSVAEEVFEVEPIFATLNQQKAIRKWVKKTYVDGEEMPDNVLPFIDGSKTDQEFISFLHECYDYIEQHGTWKHQLFEKATSDFCDDVKKAFAYLLEEKGYCEETWKQEDKFIFRLESCETYVRNLILHLSEEMTIGQYDFLEFKEAQVKKNDNGYTLVCFGVNSEGTEFPIAVRFVDATVEVHLYRADCGGNYIFENPWETLSFMASDILSKKTLGDRYLNRKEKEAVPLLKELKALSFWTSLGDEEILDFSVLKSYAEKHQFRQLIPLFDKAIKTANDSAKSRLLNQLNQAACEPMWREVYALIVESQAGYPKRIDVYDQEKLCQIRQQITRQLRALGYQGEYPTFKKTGPLKGIHLAYSYHQSYFVGMEKNVEYIVQCNEFLMADDSLAVEFISETALLKKNETITDIYSCAFNKKGRRLLKTHTCFYDQLSLIEQYVTIAVKRAECKKLNQSERKLLGTIFDWKDFVFCYLFCGGLFATLMTLAMLIISCLMTIVILGISYVPEMLREMPWLFVFLFCFVGFGGGMAITEAKAINK